MEHPQCRRLVSVPLEGDKHTGKLGVGGVSPHSGGGGGILGMVDRHGSAPHREKGGRAT